MADEVADSAVLLLLLLLLLLLPNWSLDCWYLTLNVLYMRCPDPTKLPLPPSTNSENPLSVGCVSKGGWVGRNSSVTDTVD